MYFKVKGTVKTVTAAGTRERLSDSNKKVRAVAIQALSSNLGEVYIGDNQVSSSTYGVSLAAEDGFVINSELIGDAAGFISLTDIWLDVGTSGEGVSYLYLERIE